MNLKPLLNSNLKSELAKRNFKRFVTYVKQDYKMKWFHALVCEKLTKFEKGEIKKMMVFMPPQHGKSELTTRNFPAYLLGKNPNRKVVLTSYNSTKARGFNRDVQRVIDSKAFSEVFPEVFLNNSNVVTMSGTALRNSEVFEIVGKQGSLKAVGRGGALTGDPIDIGIIDDPIKDRAEAVSATIKETLWSWYVDVFCTRLHNDSQQLIILTRWEKDDLAGRILELEPGEWEVITLEGLKEQTNFDYDPREVGEVLWPEKHSKERILKIKKNNPVTFNSLYQQDPKMSEDMGLFWNRQILEIQRILAKPIFRRKVIALDPAGTKAGDEFGITVLGEADGKAYLIADHSGNYSPKEWGELVAELAKVHKVDCIVAEQNQGGEMIKAVLRQYDKVTRVKLVHAAKSKAVRAEAVFSLYEDGRVFHLGAFPVLETQMVTFNPDKNPLSPNRVDSLVHGVTELLIVKTIKRKGVKRRN